MVDDKLFMSCYVAWRKDERIELVRLIYPEQSFKKMRRVKSIIINMHDVSPSELKKRNHRLAAEG